MITFREPKESDFGLISDSFWRGAVESCPGVGRMFLVAMLEQVIRKKEWKIKVMCEEETPDEILCWAIWRNRCEIFWVATSLRYQELGLHLGKKMFEHIGVKDDSTVSCVIIPRMVKVHASRHGIKLLHRPYLSMT